jgi:hypothetical protein
VIRGERSLIVLSADRQKLLDEEFQDTSNFNGLPSIRSVTNYVIQLVQELDDPQFIQGKEHIREHDHWEHYRHTHMKKVLAKPFPVHAIISVADNAMVDEVARYMQRVFESKRGMFPKKDGWNAMGVHCRSSNQLDKEHPFYRYLRTGRLGPDCCRFLVVNQMAVEGINNKYLSVWGVAEYIDSATVLIQRGGRFMRSAAVRVGDILYIPPASHDIVRIVTHETFGPTHAGKHKFKTAENIDRAIHYIRHMREETAGLMTLEEFVALESNFTASESHRTIKAMSLADKYAIAHLVAASLEAGSLPDVEDILRRVENIRANAAREQSATGAAWVAESADLGPLRAYAKSLIDNEPVTFTIEVNGTIEARDIDAVKDFRSSLLREEPPDAEPILEAEHLFRRPFTVDDAIAWLNEWSFGPRETSTRELWGDEVWLAHIEQLRDVLVGRFEALDFEFEETPADLIRTLANKISKFLNIKEKYATVLELVIEGSRYRLAPVPVSGLSDFEYGAVLCKSCVTFALRSEAFQRQLLKWITSRLLNTGQLRPLDELFKRGRAWEDI